MADDAKLPFEFTPVNQSIDTGSKPSFTFTPINQESSVLLPDPKPTNVYAIFGGPLESLHKRVDGQQSSQLEQLDKIGESGNAARAKIALRYDIENSGLYKTGALQPGYEDTNWEDLRDTFYSQYIKLDTKGKSDAEVYSMRQDQLKNNSQAAQYGNFRTPTTMEKISLKWDNWFGGHFNPAPKAAPIHAEGVKTEWSDLPHNAVNAALEFYLNPATLGAIATGGASLGVSAEAKIAKNVLKYSGKAFGAYAASQLPSGINKIVEDAVNPNVGKPDVLSEIASVGFQAFIAKSALTSPNLAVQAKYSVFNAFESLPKDVASQLALDLHKTTPIEAAKILNEYGDKTVGNAGSALYEASENMRKVSQIEPTDVKMLNEMHKNWTDVQNMIAPETRSAEARSTANILRASNARWRRSVAVASESLKDAADVFNNVSEDQRLQFIDNVERGIPQPELVTLTGNKVEAQKVQMFADTMRNILDSDKEILESLKPGERRAWIENYFPHLWQDPEAAKEKITNYYTGDKLLGSKNFLLKRTIPTIKEGMVSEADGGPGLIPVSTNPVDMLLIRHGQVQKYVEGQRAISELSEKGLNTFVASGSEIPEGLVRVIGPVGEVYGPKYGAVDLPNAAEGVVNPDDVRVHGKRIMGNYYAQPDVAQVLNNYSSEGLAKYASYKAYMSLSNAQNQLQLGLSGMHGTTTAVNSTISRVATGIKYAFEGVRNGDPQYFKEAFKSLSESLVSPVSDVFKGNKYRQAYVQPGSLGDQLARELDAYTSGGGVADRDQRFKTNMTSRMNNYFAQETIPSNLKGILSAPFALSEQVTGLLMDGYVPRVKLAVAIDNIRLEMRLLGKDATPEQIQEASRKVLDSVDNRFGQMNYDNLFWNKTLKDISFGTVRAVGWDLGTIREAGGAGFDSYSFLKNTMNPKKKAEFSQRMAYMVAFPMVTMTMGAIYQYLKTGEKPSELQDYFFPKNGDTDQYGKPMRSSLFAYTKDYYDYSTNTVGTVTSKINPTINTFYEMIRNKDFYGKDIVNADDPLIKEMSSFADYLIQQNTPIGIRQFEKSGVVPKTTEQRVEQFMGVGAPPKGVGKTQAEITASKILSKKPFGDKPYDANQQSELNLIEKYLRTGTQVEQNIAQDKLDDLADKGVITTREKQIIQRGTEMTYLQKSIQRMSVDEAFRVYNKSTIKEQDEIRDLLENKISREKIDSDKKEEYLDKLDTLSKKRNVDTTLR